MIFSTCCTLGGTSSSIEITLLRGAATAKSVMVLKMTPKDADDVRWLLFAWLISAIVFGTIVLLWKVFS